MADFMAFTEKYRTIARLAGSAFTHKTHISGLKQIAPRSLMDSMVMFELSKNKDLEPKTWFAYVNMLVKIYKFKNPNKVKGSIFNQGSSSKNTSEPMDTSTTEKKWKGKGKGKAQTNAAEKRHCTWCEKAGNKYAATTHDLKDCRLKDAAPKVVSAPKGSPPSKPQSGNYVSV
jgi:hypothetical protein